MQAFATTLALSVMLTVDQRDAHRMSLEAASAAVSGDGRYIAFVSYSQLALADSDQLADVYVLDRDEQHVTLESVEPSTPASMVAHPRLSGDGRMLVYQRDEVIIVRDRRANTMTALGTGRQPSVSHDGTTVVFVSNRDVYAVRHGSPPQRVSIELPGMGSSVTSSVAPSVSADGRLVAFAARLAQSHDRAPVSQVFIRDTDRQVTTRLSTGWSPALSGDGARLAFVDYARGVPHVFLADVGTGRIQLITKNTRGRLANGGSAHPSVSFDGRFVVFQSEANDLVDAEDYNLLSDVFIFNRVSDGMARVSGDPDGAWLAPSGGPSIDNLGSVVAFSSRHPTDASDKRNDFDLYVATLTRSSEGQKTFNFLATANASDQSNSRLTAFFWPSDLLLGVSLGP